MIKKILFVCTGNTCRSPMAKLLFEEMVSKDPSLRSVGAEVDSAGIIGGGSQAMQEAIDVMNEHGLDLTSHQSKPLDGRLVDWADIVLVMEHEHKQGVMIRVPKAVEKTYLLSEYVGESGDVPDPYRKSISKYRECAALLQSLLGGLIEKLKN